ncbi:MAG: AAA family ATPase [Candidatus Scalindua sp. AMX11]|nr:MAG: AAA family ATPase [Candidatus Scalindua sp.]TDE65378.1 MAG: AAA family ATPase [Candidatus Scalindua sp. AMX11]GJQ60327.1 MAG: ATPase [Candidatus Scalindua sp.]
MYEKYWNLNTLPFENVPDPRFLYRSEKHEEALMRLVYAAQTQKGAAMLTGNIGCGKTTTCRTFIQSLPVSEYEIGLIANPMLSPIDFLSEILYQLGSQKNADTKTELIHLLNEEILNNLENGKKTLLIIDEAQAIENNSTLEELRLLLNFQLNDRFLLTLILIGQPELLEHVAKLKQLDSRISIRYHLSPFELEDTREYIIFRLKIAGIKRDIITPDAIEKIHTYSGGVPRNINNICDLCLLIGFSIKSTLIDSQIVEKVIHDRGK